MTQQTIQPEEIRSAVRQRYGQIARDFDRTAASCCGPSDCCCDTASNGRPSEAIYEIPYLSQIPL